MTHKLPNASDGRRRHYWHVFSRDRGDPASWVHEIGLDCKADALAECEDIRSAGRVPRIIPCTWVTEPALLVAALNAQGARKAAGFAAAKGRGLVVPLAKGFKP